MECERQTYYDEEFFLEHGYVSCYECDETFTDISILELHQQNHLDLENSAVVKLVDTARCLRVAHCG